MRLETIAVSKMDERWTEQLRCPMCYRAGRAALFQADDADIATAERVPSGFELIQTKYSIDFICTACHVRVEL